MSELTDVFGNDGFKQWPKYPTYKSSGVDWLGDIPEHWEVKRLKNVVFLNLETISEDLNRDYVLKYIDIGNVTSEGKLVEVQEFLFKNAPSRARRKVKNNDVIISTVRTYLRAILFIQNPSENLVVSTGFAVLTPKQNINPKYLYRMIQSIEFIEKVVTNSVGVSYPAINPSKLAILPIWIPPLSEQKAIAHFLDEKTSKIDKLIAKKKQFIELLKEKRVALISHAVTKGLNPDVAMKNSGVEWLGDIPEHWGVYKNKNLFNLFNGYAFKGEFFSSLEKNAPILVTPGNFNPNGGLYFPPENTTYYTEKYPLEFQLKINDYLIVMTDLSYKKLILGSVVRVDRKGLLLNQRVAKILIHSCVINQVFKKFLLYTLNSKPLRDQVILSATGATVFHSSPKKISQCYIALPPLSEQKAIAAHLDKETKRIDEIVEKTEKSLELLKEYRTALISAGVTGKIDVR